MMSLFTRRKAIGLFRLVGLAVPFKFSPLLAAETQAATNTPDVHLLSQDARPPRRSLCKMPGFAPQPVTAPGLIQSCRM